MASSSPSRPPQPFAPQNPTPSPGSLAAPFANMQVSRAAGPPFAGPPGSGPAPSSAIRAPQGPPPGARPFPGSPPPPSQPSPPFARPGAPLQQQSPPQFGGPPPAMASQPQRPGFGGPPSGPPPQVQRAPFGGPPWGVSPQAPPFGGPPAAVASRSAPFSGPPAAASYQPAPQRSPFGGPPAAASAQPPPIGGGPFTAAQAPPFGGPPGSVPQTAPTGGLRPPFGGPSAPSQQVQFGAPPPFGGPSAVQPGAQPPPFGASQSQAPPFMGPAGGNAPPSFAPPMWQDQARPGAVPGGMQPSMRMPVMPGGMPPNALGQGMSHASTPTMPYSPHAQVSTPSKIDPNQIPRPVQETSVIIFETRQGGQAAIPPAASSEFIVKDTGNCNPRLMRCTMNQIPCTGDLLTTSGMPLALLVQPFALPHPSEEPVQVRDPMPAVYFFLIDVSMNAVNTGATAAACSAISQALSDLPEGPRTMVGIGTFDSAIHFYSLRRAQQQPLMLIVPDIQDVYTPLQTDLILPISEASFLAMKSTGGKLLVFQSVLPSVGIGSLSAREAEGRSNTSTGDKEAHKLLQPVDKTLKTMAQEFAEYQVCVDVFLSTQSYVDIASISVVPNTTGGRVYYYYPFSALSDPAKLYNDLRWNISRPQGFEAVMRVRCSQGLQVQDYFGNFCKRVPTDIDLPVIDSDKAIMVTFKHDDKLQENSECAFQCALLYTTVFGQRRIRVINLSLSCTNMLSSLFRYADLETQFTYVVKQALTKSVGLRNDGRLDDRSYWVSIDDDDSLVPSPLTLNSENIHDDGIYLLENGEDGFIYVGNSVNPLTLEQIFGVSSLAGLPNQLVLEPFDNELSRKVNEVVNEIRRQRCSYLRLRLCKKGDPSGDFFRSLLVEDKAPGGLSYVEFLVHVHRQIQSKMT
ncbi:hypothetical protein HU200_058290 [Digitaria exilis]|uniref:Protein transport protein Sec24-like CEF n=1 Tax=Digitaria exilis TaxID=1010633 RepID=A0A835AMW9_9POAL|nr:hypothetical protein HU200_058290 [Digitaria exilis]